MDDRIRDLEQIIDEEKALRARTRVLRAALGVAFLSIPTSDHWDQVLAAEIEAELQAEDERRTASITLLAEDVAILRAGAARKAAEGGVDGK